MKKLILFIFTVFVFAENFVNLKLTNKTLEISAQYIVLPQNNIYLRGSYLYHDDKDDFYSIGVKGEGNLIGSDIDNLKFSLMIDFVHTTNNSALPIGFGANYMIKNFNMPVIIRGEFEYAPEVLSFDKADKFTRFLGEAAIQPITNGEIFVGYRYISFNENYNSSFYAGVGFVF
jgi:hypothetical protein